MTVLFRCVIRIFTVPVFLLFLFLLIMNSENHGPDNRGPDPFELPWFIRELLSDKQLFAELLWFSLPRWFQLGLIADVAHMDEYNQTHEHILRLIEFEAKWAWLDDVYNTWEVPEDILEEYEREINEINALYYNN